MKLSVTKAALTISCILSIVMIYGAPVQASDHLMLGPDDLKWTDVASMAPGAKIAVIEGPLNKPVPFTFRLKLPANYKIAPHWHPAVERVTVLSGTLYFAAGDQFDPAKAKPLGPGSLAIMPVKMSMFGYTKEETIIQLHGVGPWGIHYVESADDPRKKCLPEAAPTLSNGQGMHKGHRAIVEVPGSSRVLTLTRCDP